MFEFRYEAAKVTDDNVAEIVKFCSDNNTPIPALTDIYDTNALYGADTYVVMGWDDEEGCLDTIDTIGRETFEAMYRFSNEPTNNLFTPVTAV